MVAISRAGTDSAAATYILTNLGWPTDETPERDSRADGESRSLACHGHAKRCGPNRLPPIHSNGLGPLLPSCAFAVAVNVAVKRPSEPPSEGRNQPFPARICGEPAGIRTQDTRIKSP